MPLTIDGGGNFNSTTGQPLRTGKAFVNLTETGFVSQGDVLQIRFAQAQTDSNHISKAGNSQSTLPLTCSITPYFANSVIQVQWYSMMATGGTTNASALWLSLYRSIDGGATYTNVVPIQEAYPPGPWYGWTYFQDGWSPINVVYFDRPNTTNQVTYQLRYRNGSSDTGLTNYLVHANGHHYGWILEEIGLL